MASVYLTGRGGGLGSQQQSAPKQLFQTVWNSGSFSVQLFQDACQQLGYSHRLFDFRDPSTGKTLLLVAVDLDRWDLVALLLAPDRYQNDDEEKFQIVARCLRMCDGLYARRTGDAAIRTVTAAAAARIKELASTMYATMRAEHRFRSVTAAVSTAAASTPYGRLHVAAWLDVLGELLDGRCRHFDDDDDVNINVRSSTRGRTPLHVATMFGSLRSLRALLAHNARLDETDADGRTPLHLAVEHGEREAAAIILNYVKTTISTRNDDDQKQQHECGGSSNVGCVFFGDDGAVVVDARDARGETPLHVAAKRKNTELVALLLGHGARLDVADVDGETPIQVVARRGDGRSMERVVEHLKASWLPPSSRLLNDSTVGGAASCCGNEATLNRILLGFRDRRGDSLLQIATKAGNTAVATVLARHLKPGTSKIESPGFGRAADTTMMNCVGQGGGGSGGGGSGHAATESSVADTLSTTVVECDDDVWKDCQTALHYAAATGDTEIMDALVRNNGADLDAQDDNGYTPLHVAVEAGKYRSVDWIVGRLEAQNRLRDVIEIRTKYGLTAVHAAVVRGDRRLVDSLLRHDVRLGTRDDAGNTILHLAVLHRKYAILELVVQYATSSSTGRHPKFVADVCGDESAPTTNRTTNEFRRSSTEVNDSNNNNIDYFPFATRRLFNAKNKNDLTALDLAARQGHERSVRLLVAGGAAVTEDTFFRLVQTSVDNPKLKRVFAAGGRAVVNAATAVTAPNHRQNFGLRVNKSDCVFVSSPTRLLLEGGGGRSRRTNLQAMNSDGDGVTTYRSMTKQQSPMEFACAAGEVDLLKALVDAPDVYRYEDEEHVIYKVDYLYDRCMPIIARCDDPEKTWKMLDVEPFRTMTEPIWKLGEQFIVFFIVLHLIYMVLFTFVNVPTVDFLIDHFQLESATNSTSPGEVFVKTEEPRVDESLRNWTGLWILWPVVVVIFELIFELSAERNLFTKVLAKILKGYKILRRRVKIYRHFKSAHKQMFGRSSSGPSSSSTSSAGKDFSTANELNDWETLLDHSQSRVEQMLAQISIEPIRFMKSEKWKKYCVAAVQVIFQCFSFAVLFLCLMTTWFCCYSFRGIFSSVAYQRYLEVLAVTLVIGWMMTIKYFTYILSCSLTINRFLNVIRKDIFSIFLVLFLLILLGFGFALHVLHLTILDEQGPRTPAYSIYMTFSSMLDHGDLFEATTDEVYEANGGNADLVRVIFSLYACLSTIVILHLLAAMMHDAPPDNAQDTPCRRRTRLNLRVALWMRSVPFLAWLVMPSRLIVKAVPNVDAAALDPFEFRSAGLYLWFSKQELQQNRVHRVDDGMQSSEKHDAHNDETENLNVEVDKTKIMHNKEYAGKADERRAKPDEDLGAKIDELTRRVDAIYSLCRELSKTSDKTSDE